MSMLTFVLLVAAAPVPEAAFPGQWAPPALNEKFPVWPKGCARFEGPERISCLEHVAYDWARLSRFKDANALVLPPSKGERRVVFLGDSITDNWSKAGYGGFFTGRTYLNRGIGGQVSGQMLERFRQDVLALRPRAVVILAGTNDIAGNAGAVSVETVQANLSSMAELATFHRIKVVLASLLPVNDVELGKDGKPLVRTVDRPTQTITALNAWISNYARGKKHGYVDYFAAVADTRGLLQPALTDDGLHPNTAGYAVMAPLAEAAIARAIGKR